MRIKIVENKNIRGGEMVKLSQVLTAAVLLMSLVELSEPGTFSLAISRDDFPYV